MKKDKVKSGIYNWGCYPALFLLKEEQENDNFENCKAIKDALDEVGKGSHWHLSTKVDNESMRETYERIMQDLKDPQLINHNMPYYIEAFRQYVQ